MPHKYDWGGGTPSDSLAPTPPHPTPLLIMSIPQTNNKRNANARHCTTHKRVMSRDIEPK